MMNLNVLVITTAEKTIKPTAKVGHFTVDCEPKTKYIESHSKTKISFY